MIENLKNLGLEVWTDPASMQVYSFDNGAHQQLPMAVVHPQNQLEAQKVIQFCHQHAIPLVFRGRATATTGAAVPLQEQTIVLTTEKMNRIFEVNVINQSLRVEPGALNIDVQNHLKSTNLFWPPDPGSMQVCTVGGNLACNAAGPRAFHYGSTRENVLSLKAIDGRGEIFEAGFECSKYSTGYDLTRLLIGSEGTLALITEATLKLKPKPKKLTLAQFHFKNFKDTHDAILQFRDSDLAIQSIELLDTHCLRLIQAENQIEVASQYLLIVELIDFDGNDLQSFQSIAFTHAKVACNEKEADELKQMRKRLSPAIKKIAPNRKNEDVVVPMDKLPELFELTTELEQKYQLPIINFGHAGNANIHCNIMYDGKNENETQRAEAAMLELMHGVVQLKGAISGEHGIGLAKRDFMNFAIDTHALELMKKIKSQFDPKNILNPGKIWKVD